MRIANHFRFRAVQKEQAKLPAEQEHQHQRDSGINESADGRSANSLAQPFQFSGARILSAVGRHCPSQGLDRAGHKGIQLLRRSNTGHNRRT